MGFKNAHETTKNNGCREKRNKQVGSDIPERRNPVVASGLAELRRQNWFAGKIKAVSKNRKIHNYNWRYQQLSLNS